METETAFIVPRGDPGLPALRLEMTDIYAAEQRIPEIAIVNQHKAPEMLALFNQAYLALTKMVAGLEMEMGSADRAAKKRRSVIVLDLADDILKNKGLSSSKDLRDAVVDADIMYAELQTRLETITAAREILRGKMKAIEMAYTSVKKILGDRPQLGGSHTASYTPSDPEQKTPVGSTVRYTPISHKAKSGFGGADI
jgi:hypothetical protein